MPALRITCEGEGCWPDLVGNPTVIDLTGDDAPTIFMALLPGGMASGRASVAFRLELPDGRTVVTETSLRLLSQALGMFGKHLAGRAEGE